MAARRHGDRRNARGPGGFVPPLNPATHSAARVLVVDDRDTNREVITALLRRDGYHVTPADGGREALRLLAAEKFDVVITDIFMPDVDGLEVLLAIRKMPVRPAVIVTSGGGANLEADEPLAIAEKMGATLRLPKPFTAQQLTQAVQTALEKR